MENSSISDTEIEIRKYGSHLEALQLACDNTKGRIVEFGCGHLSTPFLARIASERERFFVSYETNKEWKKVVNDDHINLVKDYMKVNPFNTGLLFVDCAPAEIRAAIIHRAKDSCSVIVVHDSEPEAEHIYGMEFVLSTFKYRKDFRTSDDVPMTTIVSNFQDVSKW